MIREASSKSNEESDDFMSMFDRSLFRHIQNVICQFIQWTKELYWTKLLQNKSRSYAFMNLFSSRHYLKVHASNLTIFVLTLTIFIYSCSEKPMKPEIILIEDDDFMYLAKVLKKYSESDTHIQVYIFNDTIRKKIGDLIPNNKLAAKRTEPKNGWGSSQLALQYYWNEEWVYSENVVEFEDYYIVPIEDGEDREIKLKHIRFPIPIQR